MKEYTQKFMVRYSVNPAIFNNLRKLVSDITENKEEILCFKPSGSINRVAYYGVVNGVEWLMVQYKYLGMVVRVDRNSNNYFCLVKCDESVELIDEIFTIPYLNTCNKYMLKVLGSKYKPDEIEEQLYAHEVEGHIQPIHELLPRFYDINVINKLHNCTYLDINNAHLDALVEIFPKASYQLKRLRYRISTLKKQGKYNEAKRIKYYINIFVGGLGQKKYLDENGDMVYAKHRQTYEWVVDRTRKKLQAIIDELKGTVLYANTDGVIVREPKGKVKISDNLGECKEELSSDIVYAFVYVPSPKERKEGYTPWYCYQYRNSKGEKELKGNVAHEVREHIDLEKGQYVVYKKVSKDGYFEYLDVELRNGEIKEYE